MGSITKHKFPRVFLVKLRAGNFRALLFLSALICHGYNHIPWIIFYNILSEPPKPFQISWQAVSMLLWLHFCSMSDSHEGVEVLGLGAYIIQETCSKCFWNLNQVEKYLKTCMSLEITYNKDFTVKATTKHFKS